MARFKFQLDSLMKYREFQRDQCRQVLADVLKQESDLLDEIKQSQTEREQVSEEIRAGSIQGELNVQQNASRRFYLTQIDQKVRQFHLQLEQTRQQLELCRKAVQQADAAVKALEQLKETRLKKHEYLEEKKLEVEMQDTWSATQQIGF